MEEARLQELRKGRELVVQREEIRYLKNLVDEQERTIRSLEEDIVQHNMVSGKTHKHAPKFANVRTQIHKFVHHYVRNE